MTNVKLKNRIEEHRADFAKCVGKPFKHFHCPILNIDEETELQKGHIINEAFNNSPKSWVVQRKDVDGFYGAMFESDFEVIQHIGKRKSVEYFIDRKLYNNFCPKIFRGTTEVKHFPYRKGNIRQGFIPVNLDNGNGLLFPVCLEISAEELNHKDPKNSWSVQVGRDFRVAALVSLIKAAHLTLFSFFGYTYALSTTGNYVGPTILGKFFSQYKGETKKIVVKNAVIFFNEFRQIVRPASKIGQDGEGTLTNGKVLLCASSSGQPWGMVIFIKTGLLCNAVLLPFPNSHSALGVYDGFLKNDHNKINVFMGKFDKDKKNWEFDRKTKEMVWPKDEECLSDGIVSVKKLVDQKSD
jgi:hypothetical protein